MKRSELASWVYPFCLNDKGFISFEARCGFDGCDHTELSEEHYKDETEAKNSVIDKMVLHYCYTHNITLDD